MRREVNTLAKLAKSMDSKLASSICAVSDKHVQPCRRLKPQRSKQQQITFRRRRDLLSATRTEHKHQKYKQKNKKMSRGKDTGAATTAEVTDSPNMIIGI